MAVTSIKNSFSAGELSPSLYGRTDLANWHQGAFTMRNMFVNYRGGASSRAGLVYVGTCKQPGTGLPPRDIPFQFSIDQAYVLEFGDGYMRIKYRGGYVTEAPTTITGINNANPIQVFDASHGYSVGNWVFISGAKGLTELNGLTWIIGSSGGPNIFTLNDLYGNPVDGSTFGTYTSGGTAQRIYEITSPYAIADLPYLKYTQDSDTMTLTCVNQKTGTEYPIYQLQRYGATNWVFTQTTFAASIQPPASVTSAATSSTTPDTFYSYVVTAVNADNGEESIASVPTSVENNDISINAGSNAISWTPVVGAAYYNVYKTTPSYMTEIPAGVLYGYMTTVFGTNAVDTDIIPDFTIVPPTHRNPFALGAIEQVTVDTPGSGYTQATISYSITTSTGTGFVGQPIVNGGLYSGFVIQNSGSGYAAADTITISDSGGGTGYATGSYNFTSGNPLAGETIILNGIGWTFVASNPGDNQSTVGSTLAATLRILRVGLIASDTTAINVASYTVAGNVLYITYRTAGAGGNSYTLAAGTYGGTPSGATLTGGTSGGGGAGTGATATLVIGSQSGTYPSVCAYFQERRVYANTENEPDTYFMTQPGAFNNMDSSIPVVDSDAITGTPWAQQVNGIQFMVPMPGGLVVFTGKGAWQVNGGGTGAAITPASQTATPQAYNGCSATVPPITVDYDILYAQAKGSIVRDLSYNFFVNIYTGDDITLFSSHLFQGYTISQWAYAEEPFKIVWAVRSDGVLLSLTYLKSDAGVIKSWSRHDTNGIVVGICSIPEPPVDAVYAIVKRYVNGGWRYYSERLDDRNWNTVEECVCLDSCLTYPQTAPNAVLTPSAATGNQNLTSVTVVFGGSGYTAPIIVANDPSGTGSGATFSVTVVGGVITAVHTVTDGSKYSFETVLTVFDSTGSGAVLEPVITNIVPFVASASVFTLANVGDVIRVGGGKAIVTGYVSGTEVNADINDQEPITLTIPDQSTNIPIPANPGEWTISTPVDVVTGLNHLEGMDVFVLADGSVQTGQTVTDGQITLEHNASQITVGLQYTCQLQTPYLEPPGQQEATQSLQKEINSVAVGIEASRGFKVGCNQVDSSILGKDVIQVSWSNDNMLEWKERTPQIYAGSALPLVTGYAFININGKWDIRGQVAIEQTNPLPLNVLSVVTYYKMGPSPG